MTQKRRLVLASRNRAKAAEIARILQDEGLDFEVVSLAEFPDVTLPPETGASFADNARDKAKHVAAATGMPAIADDSGLEVETLGGAPGVLSARYAGEGATDEQRCRKVLDLLAETPDSKRGARFRCAAAYARPDGRTRLVEGACEGRIAGRPAGSGGFGYDPIFLPEGGSRSMAEMTPAEKDAISHRGGAFRALARLIARDG